MGSTIQLVLGTMASSMLTFIVCICSAQLVAMQLASSQFILRIIDILFQDPMIRSSLLEVVFPSDITPSVLLVRGAASVTSGTVHLAASSCLASLCVFLDLMDHVGKSLRPSGALSAIASVRHEVIQRAYPKRFAPAVLDDRPTRAVLILWQGVLLALDIRRLVSLAQRADCFVELSSAGRIRREGMPAPLWERTSSCR